MIDRGVKLTLAASIMLGGAALALLFRHDGSRHGPPLPGASDRLVLRDRVLPADAVLAPVVDSTAKREGASGSGRAGRLAAGELQRSSTLVAPVKPESAPELPKPYPGAADDPDAHWGTSMSLGVASGKVATKPRRHKIADGDTLAGLAERYLGSRDRYLEIFESNRNLLSSPELLPIGATLKIPPSEGEPARPAPKP